MYNVHISLGTIKVNSDNTFGKLLEPTYFLNVGTL